MVFLAVWISLIGGCRPTAAPPDPQAHPSLVGQRWNFADGTLDHWRHKDNAQLSIVEEEDKSKALRLVSDFSKYRFTWTAKDLDPHEAQQVGEMTMRVWGDGSGHLLEVHLGAPSSRGRPLYYVNTQEAIRLDFRGWRPVRLHLDQFQTPERGVRQRDLAGVTFVEFTVRVQGKTTPVELRLQDIAFQGRVEEDPAEREARQLRRQKLAAEATAAVEQLRPALASLRKELDRQSAKGKYTAVALAYWTALDWCSRDVLRYAQAEEFEEVEHAGPLATDLKRRLDDPQIVLGRILDKPPEGSDPLHAQENPFFQSAIHAIESTTVVDRWWAKGQAGYRSVADAWAFRRYGEDLFNAVWATTRPGSPLRHHPMLLTNALNLLDVISRLHQDGDYNPQRSAIHGYDPNINRFCLAPTLDAWCELQAAYPDLLPPAWRTLLETGLHRLVDRQLREYGVDRSPYPNMDAYYLLIMDRAARLWKDDRYAQQRDMIFQRLESAVYPGGAWTYKEPQNECFCYHQIDVLFLARFWRLSGNAAALALLRRTVPYYPRNVEPAGMAEYYTDPAWKHYWIPAEAPGPGAIASLFDDPLNQRAAEVCAAIRGWGNGYPAALAADLWKHVPSKPLPDQYVFLDANIQGPRGRFGPWSFAGNGRNFGEDPRGKDTFVGCMLTDESRRPLPLDAAVQLVTTEVLLLAEDKSHGAACYQSHQERLSTTLGPEFGSLAAGYRLSHSDQDEHPILLPWRGVQAWYLSRTRLVGLVSLEAMVDDRQAAIHGRIRLGLDRPLREQGHNTWQYGGLIVTIHDHNYATIESRPSPTCVQDKPKGYRSTEITLLDPRSRAAGHTGSVVYPQGTRYHFLVEVHANSSSPAQGVRRVEDGRCVGFRFDEPGRRVLLLHNPTDQVTNFKIPQDDFGSPKKTLLYRPGNDSGQPLDAATLPLAPQSHVVLVVDRGA